MRFGRLLVALAATTAVVEAQMDDPVDERTAEAIEIGEERIAKLGRERGTSDAAVCELNDQDWSFSKTVDGDDSRRSDATGADGRLQKLIDAVNPRGLTSDDTNWYNIVSIKPRRNAKGKIPTQGDPGSSYYEVGYNPVSNYISAIDVYNKGGGTSLSDAAWSLWRKVKYERAGSQSYGDLRGIIHYSCVNKPAHFVGGDVFDDAEEGEEDVVKTFTEGDREYAALLGLDNGSLAAALLTRFPASMGQERTIESITAWLEFSTPGDQQFIGVLYQFSDS